LSIFGAVVFVSVAFAGDNRFKLKCIFVVVVVVKTNKKFEFFFLLLKI